MASAALQRGQKWTIRVSAVVCAHDLLSLLAPRGFSLTALGDILQNAILFCATTAILANVRTAAPMARLFWALMGLGMGMWLTSQVSGTTWKST